MKILQQKTLIGDYHTYTGFKNITFQARHDAQKEEKVQLVSIASLNRHRQCSYNILVLRSLRDVQKNMSTAVSVLSLVTLFVNNTQVDNGTWEEYQPNYTERSNYYYCDPSNESGGCKPVDFDPVFNNDTLFPKCCPPDAHYDAKDRGCIRQNGTGIFGVHEDLNIGVSLIKYGLEECEVIVDRFVDKDSVNKSDGEFTGLIFEDRVYANDKFCVDKVAENDEKFVIRLCREREYCLSDAAKNRSDEWCVYKCCPDTYILVDGICDRGEQSGLRVEKNKVHYERKDNYALLHGDDLHCDVANWIDFRERKFIIRTNGTLVHSGSSREYKVDEYCLDTRYNTQTKDYADFLIVCEFNQSLYVKWAVLRVAVILTCVCFVATIGVYVFIRKLKKLVERVITCFCMAGLVFYMLYALRIFYVGFGSYCAAFGYVYYYVMLSRLTWLNVLSYEIWQTLGRVRSKVGQTKDAVRKKFYYYFAYATSIPLICDVFFILANQEVYYIPEIIKPHINPTGCAIDTHKIGNYGQYIFLYLPISIFIVINLFFYTKTVSHFLRVKRDLNKIAGATTNQQRKEMKNNNKKGFIILKLGLVMGITWIYYIYDYLNSFEDISFLLTIGDILRFTNVLEGFYFLIIFVMKWKTIREFMHKLGVQKKERCVSPAVSSISTQCTTASVESLSGMAMESIKQ